MPVERQRRSGEVGDGELPELIRPDVHQLSLERLLHRWTEAWSPQRVDDGLERAVGLADEVGAQRRDTDDIECREGDDRDGDDADQDPRAQLRLSEPAQSPMRHRTPM